MIRFLFVPLILILFSSQLIAQNISIKDFVIPESRYKNLLGSFQAHYGDNKSGMLSSEYASHGGDFSASLLNLFGYNSEDESFVLNNSLNGGYSQNSSSTNYRSPYLPILQEQNSSNESTHLQSSGQYSSYLTPDKVYFYGSAAVDGSYSLYRYRTDTNGVRDYEAGEKIRTIDGTLGAGIGFGKMREASSVFSVVRIIEKLTEDGYLTRELSKNEILELVNIYARWIEYASSYDRPTKYFLDALFQKLESLGVLKEKRASAYETARVEEVFQEFIYPRMVGWTIQGGVSINRNQDEDTRSGTTGSRSIVKSEQNALNISAQYGYPFSLSLHWYSTANLAIPFAGKEKKANQYIQSALYYQLGEKIHNELNVSLSKYHQFQTSGSAPDTDHSSSDFNIGNTVRYFIENNVNVSVSISYFDRVERTEMIGFTSRNTSSGFNVNFGINYRFF